MTDTINVPLLPTKEMLDAATSHALSVNIGGHYTWSDYMRDLYVLMITTTPAQPAQVQDEVPCSTHPDAPHGFNRGSSHSLDRYVCDCEGWVPPVQDAVDQAHELALKVRAALDRTSCPDAWMRIAYESVVANYTTPQPSDAKDAARYRWLRDKHNDVCSDVGVYDGANILRGEFSELDLDYSIDAAMGQGGSDE